jgi:hypothetical protein
MNSFALLNDSDDEEQPKVVVTQKKTAPKDTAPKKAVPGQAPKAVKPSVAKTTTNATAVVTDDGEFTKESSRGGGVRGKESKEKEEYRKKHSDADPRKKHENDRRPAAG